jgi:hypothetical protein
MPAARYTAPLQLAGATAFSQTPELLDPVWVVKTFRATRWASQSVEDELIVERKTLNPGGWGKKRLPGSWPAMAIAFAVSDSGPTAQKLDPAWSEQPPSRVFAAKLKAERERRQLELAAERADALAGRRKRKKGAPAATEGATDTRSASSGRDRPRRAPPLRPPQGPSEAQAANRPLGFRASRDRRCLSRRRRVPGPPGGSPRNRPETT